MHTSNALLTACLVATAACHAQTDSRPAAPTYQPIPATGCPSVLGWLAVDEDIALGAFHLTTDRPPVVDGDTIRVDGLDASLRLICIDTEEIFRDADTRSAAETDWDSYLVSHYEDATPGRPPRFATLMGEAAKVWAEWFFDGVEEVHLELDDPLRPRGYYDRHLVHVIVEKNDQWVNYNVETVRQGFSAYFVKYGRSNRYHDEFVRAQQEARDARRGIWASEPEHACYPDYDTRLRWWAERDRALQTVARYRDAEVGLIVLGETGAWDAVVERAESTVAMIGALQRVREEGDRLMFHLAHKNRQDVLIVGTADARRAADLREQIGNYLYVNGLVELHDGEPRLQLEQVEYEKVGG